MLILVLALLAVISYFCLHTSGGFDDSDDIHSPTNENVCLTKECVQAAATIDSYIDYRVSPCDDFYEFACGSWMRETAIPEDKSHISIDSLFQEKMDRILRGLMEKEISEKESSSIKKTKIVYASCMDQNLINKIGVEPLKKILTDEFGGWPLTSDKWNESGFDLETTMKKLSDYQMTSILELNVKIDFVNKSQKYLEIRTPSLCLPIGRLYQNGRQYKHLLSYESAIYKIGGLFGLGKQTWAKDDVISIVDFEFELAKILLASPRKLEGIKMTLDEIQTKYGKAFNWKKFVSSVLSSPEIGVTDVTGDELIMNVYPSFFQKLAELIPNTTRRKIANYLVWKFVYTCVSEGLVAGEAKRVYMTLMQEFLPYSTLHEVRYKKCLTYTTNAMGQAVGKMFVKERFDNETRDLTANIIKVVKETFDQMFENLDWMDKEIKTIAKEKNAFTKYTIGYSAELDNETFLDSLYTNLTFRKDTFFENIVNIRKEKVYSKFRKLRKTEDNDRWLVVPTTTSGYNDLPDNRIVLPAGILQPTYFNKKELKSLNFGVLGFTIGHEIAHGFDNVGSQYDKFGKNLSWWPASTEEKFKERIQCIIDQYSNFTISDNFNINGELTKSENFADIIGLQQAYKAYRQWVKSQGKEEPSLPSLNFTHNQLYFISYAQIWCEKNTAAGFQLFLKYMVHTPGKYRVNGPVQNSKEFAEAFQCLEGSIMNPVKKCTF